MHRRAFLRGIGAWGAGLALADRAVLKGLGAESPPPLGRMAYQLSWIKNFQFGGCYIAEERRYYERFGVKVDLLSGGPAINPDPIVASGLALVGQSSPDFTGNAVMKGARLRCIGANYRKNSFCILSMAGTPLFGPRDMIGKKIGIQMINLVIWRAFLKLNGISPDSLQTVPVQLDYAPLITGEVDGFYGLYTDDLVQIKARGYDVHYFPLSDYGYKMFTATYTVLEDSLRDERKRAQLVAFMRGEIKGWQDAIREPATAAQLAVNVYGKGNGLNYQSQRAASAATNAIMEDDVTRRHGLFWMSPGDVEDTIRTLAAGRVKATPAMFTNEIVEEAYQGRTVL